MNKDLILVHVTTVPEAFNFFRGQIAFMKEKGFEVHAVSSSGEKLQQVGKRENIPFHDIIRSPRNISPCKDLVTIWKLYKLFKSIQPTIVHAHMPKSGLLGVIAARLAGVEVVIYGLRGLPFVTAKGLKRRLLSLSEKVACGWADRVVAVSRAIRQKIIDVGYCPDEKIVVLVNGSGNGVDAEGRFNPDMLPLNCREEIREKYDIPLNAVVLGFVGRIVADKGIVELESAWRNLREQFADLFLFLVGPLEPQDPVPNDVLERLQSDSRVKITGWINDSAPFYSALDILVLPTYREGFPNTPLEAAAMELPVVTTTVDGCPEATLDGVTGILVPPKDSMALEAALKKLILNGVLRREMGVAGRERVLQKFRPALIWQGLYETYLDLLREKHIEF